MLLRHFVPRVAAMAATGVLLVSSAAHATLVADWNFGSAITGTPTFPIAASTGTGSLTFTGNATNTAYFSGTLVNAIPGDTAGGALAVQNGTAGVNNGSSLDFHVDLTGIQDVILTYASQRTSTGFTTQTWSYSADNGATYFPATVITTVPAAFATQTVDFSSFNVLDNDAAAIFRVTLTGGSVTASSGNNRFDNAQFNGAPVPEPGSIALLAMGGVALALVGFVRRKGAGLTR